MFRTESPRVPGPGTPADVAPDPLREGCPCYVFAGFKLDPRRRKLFSTGSEAPLSVTGKSIDTLICLIGSAGRIVDKEELMRTVWPHVVVEENNLERHVSTLRRALGETPGENRFIATVPGRGYCFVAPVARTADIEQGVAIGPPAPAPARRGKWRRAIRPAWLAAAVALPGLLTLFILYSRSPGLPTTELSVALLPFESVTAGADRRLADGLVQEILHEVAGTSGLRVLPNTASSAAGKDDADLRRMARDLGVSHLVSGALWSDAGRVRVNVQLVDGASGFPVWSQQYEGEVSDPLQWQRDLAVSITQRLAPGAQAAATAGLEQSPAHGSEARLLFLRANAITGASEGNLRRALDLYDRSIALDRSFAPALAARANTLMMQLRFGLAPVEVLARAEQDASNAIGLGSGSGGAHAALGAVLMQRGHWLEAERELLLAGSRDGTSPNAILLASTGRLRDAVSAAQQAFDKAPLAMQPIMQLAQLQSTIGNDAEALRLVSLGRSLGAPQDSGAAPLIRAQAAWRGGRPAEAAAQLSLLFTPAARTAGAGAVATEVFAGSATAAASLRKLATRVPVAAMDRWNGLLPAWLFALAGDMDSAYDTVNFALDSYAGADTIGHSWYWIWAPSMSAFRSDTRFQALAGRLQLPQYWAEHGFPEGCLAGEDGMRCR